MDDLISRQAAIDALTEDEYSEFWDCIDSNVAADIIRRLPSVQPEIIRCKDCKWWDKYNDNMGYCMAARHTAYSTNWEIQIRRTYKGDFYCAHAELEEENMDEVETE